MVEFQRRLWTKGEKIRVFACSRLDSDAVTFICRKQTTYVVIHMTSTGPDTNVNNMLTSLFLFLIRNSRSWRLSYCVSTSNAPPLIVAALFNVGTIGDAFRHLML